MVITDCGDIPYPELFVHGCFGGTVSCVTVRPFLSSGCLGGSPVLCVQSPKPPTEVCAFDDTTQCDSSCFSSPFIGGAAPPTIPVLCNVSTQSGLISFSPALCHELLGTLTNDQLTHELDYFGIKNLRSTASRKRNNLKCELNKITYIELDHAMSNLSDCKKLIDVFSLKLSTYEDRMCELTKSLDTANSYIAELVTKAAEVTPETTVSTNLPLPLTFIKTNIRNITIESCIEHLNFENLGHHKVAYYGNLPYSYNGKSHPVAEYPDNPIFGSIFNEISKFDKHFSPANYTCLATLYSNGESYIPPHSDDECCILPGSLIYCLSIGAKRNIKFTSKNDLNIDHTFSLPSGSVYTMTTQSQAI